MERKANIFSIQVMHAIFEKSMQNQIIVFQNPISSFRGKVNVASIFLICGVLNIENATMVEHTTLVPKREIKV